MNRNLSIAAKSR